MIHRGKPPYFSRLDGVREHLWDGSSNVERVPEEHGVAGSSPVLPTNFAERANE